MKTHQQRSRFVRAVMLIAVLGVFALPLAWTALASFGITPVSASPSLAHYADVGIAEPNFVREVATSAVISLAATILALATAYPAAHVLSRTRFRGKAALLHSLLILASLPVMAYIIPLQDIVNRLRLLDSVAGLVLAQAAIVAPLTLYLLAGIVARLDAEPEEAARLDGATRAQIIWRVALPALAPQVAAAAVIVLALNWNLFLAPLVLAGASVKTIPVAMSDFFTFERELEWPTAAAALIASLAPLVALLLATHRVLDTLRFDAADISVSRNRKTQ